MGQGMGQDSHRVFGAGVRAFVALTVVVFAMLAVATQAQADTIYACADKTSGQARIVSASTAV